MKKTITTTLLLISITISALAQKQVKYYLPHFNENKTSISTNTSQYYLNAIDSVVYDTPSYLSAFAKNRFPTKQGKSDKYAIRGDQFFYREASLIGAFEYFYDENGKPAITIIKGLDPIAYDSLVYVFSPDSRDYECYGYLKNTYGGYDNKYKRHYIISSPEDNGSDSVYTCDIDYDWNENMNRWDNSSKLQFDHISTDYYSRYTLGSWSSNDGTDWIGGQRCKISNIEYNDEGYVEKFFFTGMELSCDTALYEYKYNSDGSYYEQIQYTYCNGQWIMNAKYSDIQWKEYLGFTRDPINMDIYLVSYDEVMLSPFSRRMNKPLYFKINLYINDEWQHVESMIFNWDIGEPGSYTKATYWLKDGIEYPRIIDSTFFNEYGDFIKSTNTVYSVPDENWQQVITLRGTTALYEMTYEEGYGQSGFMSYMVNYDNLGKPDTSFFCGEQITEFSATPNIWLSIQEYEAINTSTISIYPNPAKETINISSEQEIEHICIYDMVGRMVLQSYPQATKTELRIANLPANVYLLKARLKGGGVATEKLIINN